VGGVGGSRGEGVDGGEGGGGGDEPDAKRARTDEGTGGEEGGDGGGEAPGAGVAEPASAGSVLSLRSRSGSFGAAARGVLKRAGEGEGSAVRKKVRWPDQSAGAAPAAEAAGEIDSGGFRIGCVQQVRSGRAGGHHGGVDTGVRPMGAAPKQPLHLSSRLGPGGGGGGGGHMGEGPPALGTGSRSGRGALGEERTAGATGAARLHAGLLEPVGAVGGAQNSGQSGLLACGLGYRPQNRAP
jgi:hypothetical protein